MLRERIREAWELSKPPAYGTPTLRDEVVAREKEVIAREGRLERAQQAAASFFYVGTFVAVVVSVFSRYVLNHPFVWSLEVPTYCFFWCFCLAAGLSDWRDEQISFDLLADRFPRRLRLWTSAAGNVLIIVPFVIVLPGTLAYLQYESGQPTTGLPFTEVWGFAGILPFFVIAILLRGRLLLRQAQTLRAHR